MFPHDFLTLQATWTRGERRIGSERRRSRGPKSTRSSIASRAENGDLSGTIGGLTGRHMATWGEPIFIKNQTARSRSNGHATTDLSSLFGVDLERQIRIWRRRRRVEEHHDRGPIEPRSRRDRAAIGAPSARNPFHDHRSTVPKHQEHDRRSIVVNRGRSREDRGLILRLLLKRNSSQFGPELKPQRRSVQTAPTTPWFLAHDRFQWPRFRA